MNKRKRPESSSRPSTTTGGLNKEEKRILELIQSKKGMGATTADMRDETGIQQALVSRAITSLKKSKLIKDVSNMNNKGIKHFLAIQVEPDKSLTGGDWYTDGALDVGRIGELRNKCLSVLERYKDKSAITLDMFCISITNFERGQIQEILKNLVLDNLVMEVKSTGIGEFSASRIGELCYKLTGRKKSGNGEARVGAFASVPCGVCPHIAICSPDGVISPATCSYFPDWLKF